MYSGTLNFTLNQIYWMPHSLKEVYVLWVPTFYREIIKYSTVFITYEDTVKIFQCNYSMGI